MLSRREYQSIEATAVWHVVKLARGRQFSSKRTELAFYGQFAGCMEMYADAQTVAEYINAHKVVVAALTQ